MDLYILRHGEAVSASQAGGSDFDRYLSEQGAQVMRQAAQGMRSFVGGPLAIAASAYPRAKETAEIVQAALGPGVELTVTESLGCGVTPKAIAEIVEPLVDCARVMVVGHNPDLERLIAYLLGPEQSARVTLRTGTLAWIHTSPPMAPGSGRLLGLWSSEALAQLAS